MTIEILHNGKTTIIDESCSLATTLMNWGYTKNIFAVAINQVFIPKDKHSQTTLKQNDEIEIVAPMQGG